jgi:outer membrane protein OmpA-like peptidoglycan-associated protein
VAGAINNARLPGATDPRLSPPVRISILALLLLAGIVDLAALDAIVLPRFLATKARPAPVLPALAAIVPPAAPPAVAPAPPVVAVQEVLAPAEPAPAQESPAAPEPALAPPEPLPALLFARNVAILNSASRAILMNLHSVLTARPELQVSLNGHTDNLGPQRINALLSLRRASAARAWLVTHDIEPARITVQSFGATVPVDGITTPASRAQNRRVEIKFR